MPPGPPAIATPARSSSKTQKSSPAWTPSPWLPPSIRPWPPSPYSQPQAASHGAFRCNTSPPSLLPLSRVNCPDCQHAESAILETRTRSDGTIRRRRQCLNCSTRFTTLERFFRKLPATPKQRATINLPPPHFPARLAPEAVLTIFHSPASVTSTELARRFHVTRQAITDVRKGRSHIKVIEALSQGPLCPQCEHWSKNGYCLFGFPDPQEIGPSAAADCNIFSPKAPASDPGPQSSPPASPRSRHTP